MSRIREPFKMHTHPELLHKINGLSIAIKLHHTIKYEEHTRDSLAKAREGHPQPTWEEVIQALKEAYDVINKITEDPRKY